MNFNAIINNYNQLSIRPLNTIDHLKLRKTVASIELKKSQFKFMDFKMLIILTYPNLKLVNREHLLKFITCIQRHTRNIETRQVFEYVWTAELLESQNLFSFNLFVTQDLEIENWILNSIWSKIIEVALENSNLVQIYFLNETKLFFLYYFFKQQPNLQILKLYGFNSYESSYTQNLSIVTDYNQLESCLLQISSLYPLEDIICTIHKKTFGSFSNQMFEFGSFLYALQKSPTFNNYKFYHFLLMNCMWKFFDSNKDFCAKFYLKLIEFIIQHQCVEPKVYYFKLVTVFISILSDLVISTDDIEFTDAEEEYIISGGLIHHFLVRALNPYLKLEWKNIEEKDVLTYTICYDAILFKTINPI